MTPEQKAAYVMAQAACALIEAMGMTAANQQRSVIGASMAYDDDAFAGVITRYGIHHNSVMAIFEP